MLTPEQAQMLAGQRKIAKRALGQGRRWFLRGFLMFVISIVAGYRGGQLNVVIAIVMVLLAALCFSLGRSVRKNARASLEKIDLMTGNGERGMGNDEVPTR